MEAAAGRAALWIPANAGMTVGGGPAFYPTGGFVYTVIALRGFVRGRASNYRRGGLGAVQRLEYRRNQWQIR